MNDCIEWEGYRDAKGYGTWKVDGRFWLAHRFAYFVAHGDIPEGMNVNHKCDNPGCVNPEHLYAGTQKDNVRDMYERGRNAPLPVKRGTEHPRGKLTQEDVEAIRNDDRKLRDIAEDYGISVPHASRVRNGRRR